MVVEGISKPAAYMEYVEKGRTSRLVADYLEMLRVALSKVSIPILVAMILMVLRCEVYFML
ncbi:hypothetical protein A2U01_0032679 [Trifolium medium]|uniref:Uncharacterized protein n=1 Tax=Trifolium medium TaxID=97028 RepID=A0A392PHN9_9FABA|nr:hypothetical protein [Trifolium medium]